MPLFHRVMHIVFGGSVSCESGIWNFEKLKVKIMIYLITEKWVYKYACDNYIIIAYILYFVNIAYLTDEKMKRFCEQYKQFQAFLVACNISL